jgi:hypothetical protein
MLFRDLAWHFPPETIFQDVHVIRPQDPWREVIQSSLSACFILVVVISKQWLHVTRSTDGKSRLTEPDDVVCWEIASALARGCPILPVLVDGARMPQPTELPESIRAITERAAYHYHSDKDLEELLRIIKRAMPAGPPAELKGVNPAMSPYAGPRPFPTRMTDRFFGRQFEAHALLKMIKDSRVVLVYAPSGAGKSSLLNTRVCQSLEEHRLEVFMNARVGGALPENIKAAAIRNVFSFSVIYGLDNTATPDPKCRLGDCLRLMGRKPGSSGRVLIFDQFEELFTQHPERFEDRAGFFEELTAALNEDLDLRVVLAMRQEYINDIDPLVETLPEDFRFQRFLLKRLEREAALQAIAGPAEPYAIFSPEVAEEIVEQLNTIRVLGFDNVLVEKRGEFIEMVHLQIVCDRLWRSLPEGIKRIEMEHVQRAAGDGKLFRDFVVNALDSFYNDTVEKVARSPATPEHGSYSRELIQLGCMKFVTKDSTRTMVLRANGRTGRLPDWVVDQLEAYHLLRSEQRGGSRWYELSHDRLAETVARQMDKEVSTLLFAADLLDKVLERTRDDRGGQLRGYFKEHQEVLQECRPFHAQEGLHADESEFVFRASLVTGQDMKEWSRRVRIDFPPVHEAVLREALADASAQVRTHAAMLLGLDPVPPLSNELARLALEDEDEDVREAAARSLAMLEQPDLYQSIVKKLTDPATRVRSLRALALIRVMADLRGEAFHFELCYGSLEQRSRSLIRRQAWRIRFMDRLAAFPSVVVPAVVFSAAVSGPFKWIPGMFGWALCQAKPSPLAGLFHGITASVIWGGFIPLFLTLHREIFFQKQRNQSMFRPWGAVVAGAISGFITGLIVTLIIVGVFDMDTLAQMGWIDRWNNGLQTEQFSRAFWQDLFLRTRYGWAYAITGTGLGTAMALTVNALRASIGFNDLLKGKERLSGSKEIKKLILQIAQLTWRRAWPIPLLLLATGILAFSLLRPVAITDGKKGNMNKVSVRGRVLGVTVDCASQLVGGFGALVGMGLGIVVTSRGFQVQPRKDQA